MIVRWWKLNKWRHQHNLVVVINVYLISGGNEIKMQPLRVSVTEGHRSMLNVSVIQIVGTYLFYNKYPITEPLSL